MRENKRLFAYAVAMLVTGLTLFVAASAAEQLSGTWKMNPEKSKYSPGPAPQSLTVVVESDNDGYKIDATGIGGDGTSTHAQFSAKFDGKDYPATGLTNADTVSVKRVNANTVETSQRKDGKVVMTITTTVAKDGKTRTSTYRGKNAQGKDVYNVVVFDKQ